MDTFSGGVKDCAGNRGRDAHHGDLTDAFHAERVHVRVVLLDEDHVHERRGVGVDRHCVFDEVGVRNPPVAGIHHRMLHERHTDSADHASYALATTRLRVDDATGPVGADNAPHARLPEIWVHGDFHEHGTECMHRKAPALVTGLNVSHCLDGLGDATHRIHQVIGPSAGDGVLAHLAAGRLNGT